MNHTSDYQPVTGHLPNSYTETLVYCCNDIPELLNMTLRCILAGIAVSIFATGCAFFDEPMSDTGIDVPSGLPAEAPAPTEPLPAPTATTDAQTSTTTTTTARQTTTAASGGNYLVVAPIESFPQDATNIAVLHLTSRSSDRDLAICKALMQNFTTIDVQDVPAEPLTVTVWPVPNDNAGANCIEMITEYEAIGLTADAEQRIGESDKGPFMLTRHLPTGKRMIYDLSFKTNSSLSSAVNQWITLLGSDPTNWPDYRRAR